MGERDEGQPPAPRQRRWHELHLWQLQPLRDVAVAAGLFGVLWLGAKLSLVTVPMLLALGLAYLFEPVVRWLKERFGLGRRSAASVIIAVVVLAIVGPLTITVGVGAAQAVAFTQTLATNVDRLYRSIQDPDDEALAERLGPFWRGVRNYLLEEELAPDDEDLDAAPPEQEPPTTESEDAPPEGPVLADEGPVGFVVEWLRANTRVIENLRETLSRQAVQTGRGALQSAFGLLSSLSLLGFTGFLTAFFFFFFSTGYAKFIRFCDGLLPDRDREQIRHLVGRMDAVIAGFVRGRITIALIQSVMFTVGFWLIGVPASLVLGPAVAFLSIVPYLALVGLPVAILLMLLEPAAVAWQDAWWWTLAAPTVLYFGLQALDDYVWTPLIQGRSTDMATPAILFASLAGGVLAGVYGLLLGIPVAACTKILLNEVLMPRVVAWKEGRAPDPLPFGPDGDD